MWWAQLLNGITALHGAPFSGPVVTGGTLTSDATYFYRTFTSTNNLVVSGGTLTADILVVAGGAGGGAASGGGGGAGGLLAFTSQSLASGTYVCTIGGGGTGANSGSENRGGTGVDSQFGSLTLVKGGGGGASGNGGSGVVIIRYLGAQKGTGGTVTSSGGYTIHTFTSSGTYTA